MHNLLGALSEISYEKYNTISKTVLCYSLFNSRYRELSDINQYKLFSHLSLFLSSNKALRLISLSRALFHIHIGPDFLAPFILLHK